MDSLKDLISRCPKGTCHRHGQCMMMPCKVPPRSAEFGSGPEADDNRICCRSSVVEHPLGKGEAESSIPSGSTSILQPAPCTLAVEEHGFHLYLVAIYPDRTELLAQFFGHSRAAMFWEAYNAHAKSMHAMGSMGI